MRTRILLSFALFLTGTVALAQTAQINGTIRDASGLAIPGAAVKVTQTATGVSRTAISGSDGGYVLPNLPIGPYLLEVTKDGFTKYAQSGIVLEVNTAPTVDVSMKVGSVSEQVTVEAAAIQVETRTQSVGQVVDTARVLDMPLNGREVHELIFLAGMANYPGTASLNTVRNYPTVVVSVAGGAPDSVAYNLDGVIHQDPYNNLSLPLPFPDALQEFKVETSAVPAQYGYHSTAAVNAVTKSGTNAFHGDLFEFLRNGDLNANDFFNNQAGRPRDTLKRNQYGGTIGGPIRKDKLFFFGGYQRTDLRSDGVQSTAFIPTPDMVNGNFTGITSPQCNSGTQINLPSSLGFSNNRIDPALLSPVAQAVLKTFPTTANPCGRTGYQLANKYDEDLVTAKVDWQASAKHSIFGRWTTAKLNQASTYDGSNPLSISSYGFNDLDYSLALGDTFVMSPSLVSSLKVSASRTNIVKVPDNFHPWNYFGNANVSPLAGNIIAIAAGSEFNVGGGAAAPGASHNGPLWSVFEDVNWVKGPHQVTFGGSIYRQMLNYYSAPFAQGTATFDGSFSASGALPSAANLLTDFMLGHPSQFQQGTAYGFYSRQYYAAMYIQDSWKISSRLTANFGVRWEPYLSVFQKSTAQDEHFDPMLFTQGVHSQYYRNAPAGIVFSGDPQYSCGNSFNCDDWHKFYPRVGLAWDPKGNGKMTVRAAYGMFGDRMTMLSLSQEQFGPPFGNIVSLSGVNLANPWANYPGIPGLPAGQNPMAILSAQDAIGHQSPTIPFLPFGTYVTSPLTNFHPTYVNQWNLSIQRQLGQGWLVSANYLGTSTIHFVSGESVDPAQYISGTSPTPTGCPRNQATGLFPNSCTANTNSRRLLYLQSSTGGRFGGIGIADDGGTASYQGLTLSAQRRFSTGVNILVNYTYSHCISDPWNQNPTAAGVAIPGARRQWRSNCVGTDLRHLFNLSAVYMTPKFSGRAARILASNWELAPIMSIKSGPFFSVLAGPDQALTGVPGQPASLTNTNPYPNNQNVDHWLNPAAFALPALGTYGNLGLNTLKGPGVFQLNLALSRNFPVGERRSFQLRGEAFNLPNHLNPFTPGIGPINGTLFGGQVSRTAPNFGQITSDISGNNGQQAGDYRVIQLALKFQF
jgi:hypothetical protein